MRFELRLPKDKFLLWDHVYAKMGAALGRPLFSTERFRIQSGGVGAARLTDEEYIYEFDFTPDLPRDIGINLDTMMEHGLCDMSKSAMGYAGPMPLSFSPPTTLEWKVEDPTAFDPSTTTWTLAGQTIEASEYVSNTIYIVNGSELTSTAELSNSIGSVVTYSGAEPTFVPGTLAVAAGTWRSR